ncbi:MAG: hypothetical protein M3O67_10740, partial [Bacteroidota bacterium]|nr:hypothetical protein [Bacteroidota bacterium]
LHPAGGNVEHLLKTASVIIISHSIALLAIPFLAVGFWGLTKKVGTDNFFSVTAFAMVLLGLIAGMIAATINGLALPIYIQNYREASPDITASINPILKNNIAINQAFDFVFIGAICLSTLFWSIAIVLTKKIPLWIGYSGIILFILVIGMLVSGFVFVNLHGFRLYILANVMWFGLIAIVLINSKVDKLNNSFEG